MEGFCLNVRVIYWGHMFHLETASDTSPNYYPWNFVISIYIFLGIFIQTLALFDFFFHLFVLFLSLLGCIHWLDKLSHHSPDKQVSKDRRMSPTEAEFLRLLLPTLMQALATAQVDTNSQMLRYIRFQIGPQITVLYGFKLAGMNKYSERIYCWAVPSGICFLFFYFMVDLHAVSKMLLLSVNICKNIKHWVVNKLLWSMKLHKWRCV